nr:RecName: Full=Thrombin-like enzyme Cdc SI; Short=SVTLE; AltName: Full=Fibrinogen-clotting enzyme; AltName: Full=Snake venom serine protease; Short=SVSP [Crotalus durissus cumanensis]
VIGGDECNIN